MLPNRCPGQDPRFWKPTDIAERLCPSCGAAIEFWKDDVRRPCPACGAVVANPGFDLGCAAWCQYADRCLGDAAADAAGQVAPAGQGGQALRDGLIDAMKDVFGDDGRRIRHALRVLGYAERILAAEPADPLVVKAAAVLHDIGIREAEAKHGSSGARFQELEGPPIARGILERRGVVAERIDHICRIIAEHHSARTIDTPEFRILWDADHLVNLFDEASGPPPGGATVERVFRTATGRTIALGLLDAEAQRSDDEPADARPRPEPPAR